MLRADETLQQTGASQSNSGAPPSRTADQTVEALRRILVGHTIADVERHLILDTLAYCLGNRTHAARILGISIRTLRNKLNEYADEGVAITPPGNGDHRAFVATA